MVSAIHLRVPHLQQQQPGECLAACAQMILTHLNLLVTYERLLKLLRVKSGFGTPASNIRHLETLNVEVSYQSLGTFEDLFDHLSQGRPCIAFIKPANFFTITGIPLSSASNRLPGRRFAWRLPAAGPRHAWVVHRRVFCTPD